LVKDVFLNIVRGSRRLTQQRDRHRTRVLGRSAARSRGNT